MAKVTLKNLKRTYAGDVAAVSNFNLDIEDKEFVILVGPSGSGKSTTLRMIAGLEDITGGEIYIGDTLANKIEPKDRDIAVLFHHNALYPQMTVFDNMAFGLKMRRTPKEEINRRVEETAKLLNISHLLDRAADNLTDKQKQTVALGRAIVRDPKVVLLDEPLSEFDEKLQAQMRTEFSKLHKKLGTTFIYVTDDQKEAMALGDRIVVMKEGVIQQVGSPKKLYNHPCNEFVAGFIGTPSMNFIDALVVQQNDHHSIKIRDYVISLPSKKSKVLKEKKKGRLVVGIRPEHIYYDAKHLQDAGEESIEVQVTAIQTTEMKKYFSFHLYNRSMIARMDQKNELRVEDKIRITFDKEKIHLFEKDTRKSIFE